MDTIASVLSDSALYYKLDVLYISEDALAPGVGVTAHYKKKSYCKKLSNSLSAFSKTYLLRGSKSADSLTYSACRVVVFKNVPSSSASSKSVRAAEIWKEYEQYNSDKLHKQVLKSSGESGDKNTEQELAGHGRIKAKEDFLEIFVKKLTLPSKNLDMFELKLNYGTVLIRRAD